MSKLVKHLSRRDFLKAAGTVSFATILTACAAPTPVTPAAPQPTAPAAAAPATAVPAQPTVAAAAPATAVPATSSVTQAPAPVQKPVSGNRVKVQWWMDIQNEVDLKYYIAGVDKVNAEQDKIEVDLVKGQNNDAFVTAVTGGNAPDIYLCWDGAEPLGSWANNGMIMDLTDMMNSSSLDLKRFQKAAVDMVTYNGKYYGVPWQADVMLLFWNKNHFKEAGLDPEKPPANMTEAMAMGQKLTQKDSSGKISRMGLQPPTWNGPWYTFMGFYKPQLVDIGNKKVTADSPEMIAALTDMQTMWNMYDKDPTKVDAFNATLGNGLSPDDPFLTGKVSMVYDGDWRNVYEYRYTQSKYKTDYGMIPFPPPAGKESMNGTSYFFCYPQVIPHNSPHPQEAWQAIMLITDPQIDKTIAFIGNNPANASLLDDAELLATPGFEVPFSILKNYQEMQFTLPVTPVTAQLSTAIQAQIDLVIHNKATPAEACKGINDAVQPEWDAIT